MKKIMIFLFILLFLLFPSGCYKERIELFDISIVNGTFSYEGERSIMFLEKSINTFSISFIDSGEITTENNDYDINEFGDFSLSKIKVYNINIEIEFDGVVHQCDSSFIGVANPQRANAYRLLVTIPKFNDKQNEFIMVLDFDRNDVNNNGLKIINVQIIDNINPTSDRVDAYFDIVIQNNY